MESFAQFLSAEMFWGVHGAEVESKQVNNTTNLEHFHSTRIK